VAAVPAEIVGAFRDTSVFARAQAGQYFVFDRRAQAVYGIDTALTSAWKIVQVGQERGHIYRPHAFAVEPGGRFAVVDQPSDQERLQFFTGAGMVLDGGFTLARRRSAPVEQGDSISNGIGSLQFTGTSVLFNVPENGALVTEHTLAGPSTRTFGALRATGHEDETELHLALNTGIPVVNPRGGYYFVFVTGTPVFRKYDAAGNLAFERHIEGRELDESIAALPQKWIIRRDVTGGDREQPVVTSLVRAAAADSAGNLWISFAVPYTYVYDPDGEKIRVVQFYGAGLLRPASLFFAGLGRLLVAPGCYEFRTGPG
jgi:hypothetical protein